MLYRYNLVDTVTEIIHQDNRAVNPGWFIRISGLGLLVKIALTEDPPPPHVAGQPVRIIFELPAVVNSMDKEGDDNGGNK